jgi:indole-3-glycerol phosphate synthase
MPDILSEIVTRKRTDLSTAKAARPLSVLQDAVRAAGPTRGFAKALAAKSAGNGLALITEIKMRSPSGGMIRPQFDPASIARTYQQAGSACLSVLTDEPYFGGTLAHMRMARTACTLPVLRKDFMIDPYQVVEARADGADCILLIMAALSDSQAAELEAAALALNLDVLVEVHDRAELDRALKLRTTLLGINNRNLKTLVTSLETTTELSLHVPENKVVISESGLKTHADLLRMVDVGVRRFLVGESLLRQADVGAATRALLGLALDS